MAIRKVFAKMYRAAKMKGRPLKDLRWLSSLKRRSPETYDVDKIDEKTLLPDEDKRCDYIVLCRGASVDTWIYLVESKGRDPDFCRVHAQLENGAEFVAAHLQKEKSFDFLPVLIGKVSPAARQELRKKKVWLGEIEQGIEHITMRQTLPEIMDSVE